MNLIDKADEALKQLDEDKRTDYLIDIVYEAGKFWLRAGCLSDFCLQHAGSGTIVFGGVNRVTWSAYGFKVDKSYCSQGFIKANAKYC